MVKKKFKNILIGLGIFVAIVGVGFITGEIQAIYNKTVGKDITNSENTKFHEI